METIGNLHTDEKNFERNDSKLFDIMFVFVAFYTFYWLKGPVIIHHLGGGRGGVGGLWGGSVVTESPKGGITENFGRIQSGGPLKSA